MSLTPLPADQEARDRALSPGDSFHLEAPAGSGKTSVLLARFLTLLSRVAEPEELLALTFTRKAAGELRARVMKLLWSRQDLGPDAKPLDLLLDGLAQKVLRHYGDGLSLKVAPERLPIMTFHSFCAQLLRLAPQEAGVPLDFTLLEEADAAWLMQEAVEELRRRLADRPQEDQGRRALVRRLVRLNNDWPRVARELQGLLARRDSLRDFLELASLSREPAAYGELLQARFRLMMPATLSDLAQGFAACDLGQRWPEFHRALAGAPLAQELPPQLPGTAASDLGGWQDLARALLTKQGEPRRDLGFKYGFPPGLDRGWAQVFQELPPEVVALLKECRQWTETAVMPEEVPALQDLLILLMQALTVYAELLAQRQALDFIALEEAALRLLDAEDVSDLLLRLDRRLCHVLVDEFQDTSENQMLLLCRLLAGWSPEGGRSLTVVGDPKQSIYGWRQAKVRLFVASREGLPCEPVYPLEPLLLATNFRASRSLIAWANGVFSSQPLASGVEFHPAAPRPDAPAGAAPELMLFPGSKDAARTAEARWLAREVARAAAGLQKDETIGLLLFTRTHLPVYLRALNEAGLPVRVKEGLKLEESPVVQHLHNLVRALVRPQDEVAWAAALRGPWSREPLGTLVRVAQTPGAVWPEKLARLAADPACPPGLAQLGGLLAAVWGQVARRPLAEVITQFLYQAPAWEGLAAWEGAPGVANARAYLELLTAAEMGLPEATLRKAEFLLESAYQPPDPRAQDSPVEVLTVHGAKGLEYDQVFLPFLDWQPVAKDRRGVPPFLLEEIPGTGRHALALARPYLRESQSSLYLMLRHLRDRRILAEARRVFYVAVTRARQRLVMSGILTRDAPPRESPLGWLWAHYRPEAPPLGMAGRWPDPEMLVAQGPEVPVPLPPERPLLELPPPWEFQPEAAPYRLEFPSQLAEAPEAAPAGEGGEAGAAARARGNVTHRLLEHLAQGRDLPGTAQVAAALRQEGLPPEAAGPLASEILAEVAACLQDPFLAPLLAPDLPQARSEWALEAQAAAGVVRRGQMDRLVLVDGTWWLLDYKTSRPEAGEGWDEFLAREADKYRPQLQAYREMAAKALKVEPPGAIRLVLYFTACRRAVLL